MPLTIISKISLYSCLVIQVPTINYDKMNIMQVHTIGQQSNDIKTKNDILRSKVNMLWMVTYMTDSEIQNEEIKNHNVRGNFTI